MIESTITAEDLTLYALDLLEGDERVHVETMLRKSTAAREELASIRGDLALFALGAEQHTPPALTRQRLLKQVARERRTVPVDVPVHDTGASSANTFRIDQEVPGRQRTRERQPVSTGQRSYSAEDLDDLVTDPSPQPAPAPPRTVPTRTFPSRLQQMRSAGPKPQVAQQRATREVQAAAEPIAEVFSTTPASFVAETTGAASDRQTFSADPQVFPRESRSLPTSATAHSVTMFEQHFASESTPAPREPELPPDPEAFSGRRRNQMEDPLAEVQDTFVPSNASREENFGFSAYRDRELEESRGNGSTRWMGWAGWTIAAAVTVAAVFALRDDFSLREQVSQQQSSLSTVESGAARAENVLQTLQSTSTQHFLLATTEAAPSPTGRVSYLPEHGTLIFQGNSLETLQPYKTYELWLIPAGEGRQPIPAGLFKPDAHGYATVVLPQLPKGLVATNFGVTIEDEGGAATPTLPILLVGQQS